MDVGRWLLAALLAGLAVAANGQTIVFESDGVATTLPSGWVRIPQAEIERMRRDLQVEAPNAHIPNYDFGYQAPSGGGWITYPYILVQISRAGRLRPSAIESIAHADLGRIEEGISDATNSSFSNLRIGGIRYDPNANLLWFRTRMDVPNVGTVLGINAMVPTERGFVSFAGYATEDRFPLLSRDFTGMMSRLSISEEVRYRHHASDNLPPWLQEISVETVAQGASVGILLAVAGSVYGLARRRSKRKS